MEFSRHEYWSRLPFPPPVDLPNLGIKPRSPTLRADSLLSKWPGKSFPFWFILIFFCYRWLKFGPSSKIVFNRICFPINISLSTEQYVLKFKNNFISENLWREISSSGTCRKNNLPLLSVCFSFLRCHNFTIKSVLWVQDQWIMLSFFKFKLNS